MIAKRSHGYTAISSCIAHNELYICPEYLYNTPLLYWIIKAGWLLIYSDRLKLKHDSARKLFSIEIRYRRYVWYLLDKETLSLLYARQVHDANVFQQAPRVNAVSQSRWILSLRVHSKSNIRRIRGLKLSATGSTRKYDIALRGGSKSWIHFVYPEPLGKTGALSHLVMPSSPSSILFSHLISLFWRHCRWDFFPHPSKRTKLFYETFRSPNSHGIKIMK